MTEFLARISARRPLLIIAIWAVIGLIAGGFAVDAEMAPGPKPLTDILDRGTTTEFRLRSSAESERADRLLEDRLRGPKPINEIVIVQSDSLTVDAPEFQAKVEAVYDDVLSLGGDIVKPTPQQNYYLTNDPTLVSSNDRMTTVVPLVMTGPFEDALENIPAVLHVVEEADGKDGFRVFLVGDASTNHDNNELAENDLRQGERVGIPIALVILVVLFGTIAAALMPIGLSIMCIVVAMGIAALIGQTFDLFFFVTLMIIMIGLAVGIDYSLVIISRYREELARGLDTKAAIERTGATAGRTVLFSGLTVIIALCGLLIVPFSPLPVPRPWRDRGRIRCVGGHPHAPCPPTWRSSGRESTTCPSHSSAREGSDPSAESSGHGFWEVVTRVVTRFPVISIIVVGAPMIAATVFYFQIETGINGVDVFPEGTQTREAFFVMEENFPGLRQLQPHRYRYRRRYRQSPDAAGHRKAQGVSRGGPRSASRSWPCRQRRQRPGTADGYHPRRASQPGLRRRRGDHPRRVHPRRIRGGRRGGLRRRRDRARLPTYSPSSEATRPSSSPSCSGSASSCSCSSSGP